MNRDDRAAIIVTRRRFIGAALTAAGLGVSCGPPVAPHPQLSVPPDRRSDPQPSDVDAHGSGGADAGTTIATGPQVLGPELDALEHWTLDRQKRRLVPRAPFPFVGDQLDPPPPRASALAPRVARSMGNLSDRFAAASQAKAALAPSSYPVLDELAALMRASQWKVEVKLELDPDPTFCMSTTTATKRADAIRKYLIQQGIAAARLEATGDGKFSERGEAACPDGKRYYQRLAVVIK